MHGGVHEDRLPRAPSNRSVLCRACCRSSETALSLIEKESHWSDVQLILSAADYSPDARCHTTQHVCFVNDIVLVQCCRYEHDSAACRGRNGRHITFYFRIKENMTSERTLRMLFDSIVVDWESNLPSAPSSEKTLHGASKIDRVLSAPTVARSPLVCIRHFRLPRNGRERRDHEPRQHQLIQDML